ncbi:MAG: glycosyltransferase [Alphaproteobacteria bacterium]
MRIAFIGSSLVTSYRNGSATYCRGVLRALAERGHRITLYEPNTRERELHRDIPNPDWARIVAYPVDRAGVAGVIDKARSADTIIKASGIGAFDTLFEASLPGLRRPGRSVIFWDMEPAVTLERVRGDVNDPLRVLLPLFDLVLIRGGGRPAVARYLKLGARACVPIYNAVDPRVHHPIPTDERFAADVAFLGDLAPDRAPRVVELLFAVAETLPHRRFQVAGSGWDGVTLPANVRSLGHVRTADHNAVNCSALAVLSIARTPMARDGLAPSSRMFEAAGAAACIISDDWPGLASFFEPDTEILVANDRSDVIDHLETLDAARAGAIGVAARRRALGMHTFVHRAALVEAVLTRTRAQPLEVRI